MPWEPRVRHKPNVNQRLIDYQTRKSVHINLTKSTHAELRILLLKKGLSMQVVFDRLASMICDKNPYLLSVLDTIEIEKKEKQLKQVTNSDAESIFDLIETANPFESLEYKEATEDD